MATSVRSPGRGQLEPFFQGMFSFRLPKQFTLCCIELVPGERTREK
jgi:hypothetical protein